MRTLIVVALLTSSLGIASGSSAQASGNPSGTGQPSVSCQDTSGPNFPGNTGSSPGSAFNGSAGAVYANPDSQGGISSGNTHVVSQYDVACIQNKSHM
jgi:hypothetical protein